MLVDSQAHVWESLGISERIMQRPGLDFRVVAGSGDGELLRYYWVDIVRDVLSWKPMSIRGLQPADCFGTEIRISIDDAVLIDLKELSHWSPMPRT